MKYYLGPWQWSTNPVPGWAPPAGTIGLVDLGTLDSVSRASGTLRDIGFFAVDDHRKLPSEYYLLGTGDCRESNVNTAVKSAWKKLTGHEPRGNTVADLLWDHLTHGSDPEGNTTCLPIVPTADNVIELHLHGHTRLRREPVRWARGPNSSGSNYPAKLKRLLHSQFREEWNKSTDNARRVVDLWCEKYQLSKYHWREFVPQDLQPHVAGPLPHNTTINEDFTRADGTTIGNLLTWTEVTGDFRTISNQLRLNVYDGTFDFARAESDLSSADHYAQIDVTGFVGGNDFSAGPMVRFSASATTGYFMFARGTDNNYSILKVVTGTITTVQASTTTINDNTYKIQANGSTISLFRGGGSQLNATDTSITGNLRTGVHLRAPSSTADQVDNFQAADLAVAGPIGKVISKQQAVMNRAVFY